MSAKRISSETSSQIEVEERDWAPVVTSLLLSAIDGETSGGAPADLDMLATITDTTTTTTICYIIHGDHTSDHTKQTELVQPSTPVVQSSLFTW